MILKKDALLGVSICGIMDNPSVLLNPQTLQIGAKVVRYVNEVIARTIGINPAARTTCTKPEGSSSLLLNSGSGIHPHHAHRYLRRVRANRNEPVYLHFKKNNAHMTEADIYKADIDDVISFPVEAPQGAIIKSDINALQFLEYVKLVQENWVIPGTRPENRNPDLFHNVSNTVSVGPKEWDAVENYIWENRQYFTGISLLPADGDKVYKQAPREEISTEADILKWNSYKYVPVDYREMNENEDTTNLKEQVACAGGVCEL
jgi:ribonucleoside-diphosphate reductase alpha chain